MRILLFSIIGFLPGLFVNADDSSPAPALDQIILDQRTDNIVNDVNLGALPVDVEFFAAQPTIQRPNLSPSGKYLVGLIHDAGRPLLWIKQLFADTNPLVIADSQWKIRWFNWISDTQLIVGVDVPRDYFGTPITVSRLMHVDVVTRKTKLLFAKEKSKGFHYRQDSVISTLDNQSGNFLIQASKQVPPRMSVYKVNANSRKLPASRVQGSEKGVLHWQADRLGNVRAGYGFTADQTTPVLKLKNSAGDWVDFSHLSKDREAQVLGLPTTNMDLVYLQMFASDAGERQQAYRSVYEFDVRTGQEKKIFGRSDSEVSSLILDEQGRNILAVSYHNEEVEREIFDPEWLSVQKTLDKHFPDTRNGVVDVSTDRKIALFSVQAPDVPPSFYIYRVADRQIDPLKRTYPPLADVELGKVFDVSYTARDGLEIPAYLTLPAGRTPATARNMPFVVLPHGGPHARDFKRFDWLTQLIVNRGYGVLQMNFRGSTGYGVAFRKAGNKQWGQAMQDDITDGTHWLVEQGMADAEKICIVGGSYGGYAALMGVMKEPDLYRCAVSYNGVSDLRSLLTLFNKFVGGRFSTRHIGRLWNDRKMLANNSPINLTANLKAPLLLIHSEKDRVVNIRQTKRVAKILSKQKPGLSEFVELPGGDHYLSGYDNRITFAKTLTAFLQTHLDTTTPGASVSLR